MFTFILEMRFNFLFLYEKGRQNLPHLEDYGIIGNDIQCKQEKEDHLTKCVQIDVGSLKGVRTPKIQKNLNSNN